MAEISTIKQTPSIFIGKVLLACDKILEFWYKLPDLIFGMFIIGGTKAHNKEYTYILQ